MATTIRGRHSGRWGLLLARALRNGEGRLLGVLAAHVGLENTFLSFYRSLGLPDGASIAVWNRQGTLLLRHPFIESKIGAQADLPQLAPLLEDLRSILARHGGMCLVSDALWLRH